MAVVTSLAFSYVMGRNDGASLVAANVPNRLLGGFGSSLVLSFAVGLVPVVVGFGVAETIAFRLVGLGGSNGRAIAVAGVSVAIGVVLVMSRWGLPTSLTLALVGAIVGAGIGGGLPVDWRPILGVVAIGVAAPVIAGVVASAIRTLFGHAPLAPSRRSSRRLVHVASFLLQAIAYGANDGQKAFAVVLVVFGAHQQAHLDWWELLGVAGLFCVGSVAGRRSALRGLGSRLAPERMHHSMVAQFASAASVGASAMLGMPVSMTQACAAGLVGSTAIESSRRVRWEQAVRLVHAWLFTLPASLVIGVIAGSAISVLR